LIRAEGLSKTYGDRELWKDLSFTVPVGTIVAITGPSGAGKTTLLNCIGGLVKPDGGVLEVAGKQPGMIRGRERTLFFRDTVSFLFQNSGLVDELSVSRNLDLAMEPIGLRSKDAKRNKADVLKRVGLQHARNSPAHRLSGGERQRVALARLMLKRGEVILADEPSSALDDANCRVLRDVLLEQRRAGTTILVSTHDPRILQFCDDALNIGEIPSHAELIST
jgi:putative ABC transport system ATP-binding protein